MRVSPRSYGTDGGACKTKPKQGMKRYCQWCRKRLLLREMRCPYCRDPAISWLHGTVIAIAGGVVLFFLMQAL